MSAEAAVAGVAFAAVIVNDMVVVVFIDNFVLQLLLLDFSSYIIIMTIIISNVISLFNIRSEVMKRAPKLKACEYKRR